MMETLSMVLGALPPGLAELVGATIGGFTAGIGSRVLLARLLVRVSDLEVASELRDAEDGRRPSALEQARAQRGAAAVPR
jgi:hypothetical protein